MSKAEAGQTNNGNAMLSDEALKEIAAGMNSHDAQFMAKNLYDQLTNSETGPAMLESGYSEEDAVAALEAAFKTIKLK